VSDLASFEIDFSINKSMKQTIFEAAAGILFEDKRTLDTFQSELDIIKALKKVSGVSQALKTLNADVYFDDDDFVIGATTALAGALFNPKVSIVDLAKLVNTAASEFKAIDKPNMPNRVIVSAKNETLAKKILAQIKDNNKKAKPEARVKATAYKRTGGVFKVYITGKNSDAIEQYKSLGESEEMYETVSDE
jgi:hypothetical protein